MTRSGTEAGLMAYRVRHILVVASRFDTFLLEEEGALAERIAQEYGKIGLSLRDAPRVTAVGRGDDALALLPDSDVDMVVTTSRLPDMALAEFGRRLRAGAPEVSLGVLAPHAWELPSLEGLAESGVADWILLWQGDAATLLAGIELEEDRRNAEHDVLSGGAQVLLLVEDDIRFLSFFLPNLFGEVTRQTGRVVAEGLSFSHRRARLQARPKILLARTFEDALALWRRFGEHTLGVVADVAFSRGGRLDPEAGIELLRAIRGGDPDVPVVLQSAEEVNRSAAEALGASFLHKEAADLLPAFRGLMLEQFGFGDFVFRLADRREVGRARDLRELRERLEEMPAEALAYHAAHNHFSRWFAARTEFDLAAAVRPRRVSEFADLEALREYLVATVTGYLQSMQRHTLVEFAAPRFDRIVTFARIGSGSLGGKGRGLAFAHKLFAEEEPAIAGGALAIPPTVVLATDLFEQFLEDNALRDLGADSGRSDGDILDAVRRGRFSRALRGDLAAYLQVIREPLAVRSSSLLEDSPHQPFSGVYATVMLPNSHPSLDVRLAQLLEAIKVVYASTFMAAARQYLAGTPHRLEEERMGVLLQRLVGSRHGSHFYPTFSGVASSHNFYPFNSLRAEDGVALVAAGLGKAVVEGFEALRFCPAAPSVLPQLSTVKDTLRNAQRRMWVLDMTQDGAIPGLPVDANLAMLDAHRALEGPWGAQIGSTFLKGNDTIVDGVSGGGVGLVTFSRILKGRAFPLPALLEWVLAAVQRGMGTAVEVEFAADLAAPGPPTLHVLQVRPMAVEQQAAAAVLDAPPAGAVVVQSPAALGPTRCHGVTDLVVVSAELPRSRTADAAAALEDLNRALGRAGRPYVLVGPGRWGTRDPWLGIPVSWSQISSAQAIVETDFADLDIEPSQGSHFFHNLTAAGVAFLPVHPRGAGGRIDWGWLERLPPVAAALDGLVRHLRLAEPVQLVVDGAVRRGALIAGGGP